MKIEVGKKYTNAEGNIITIVKDDDSDLFPMISSNGSYYEKNGNFDVDEHKQDVICEVNEDIYTAFKQDLITKKEFLNKHFELYSGTTLEQYNAKNQDN